MIIAVACEGLSIAQQPANCNSFACYTVDNGIIVGCHNVPNMGLTARERADMLTQMGVSAILARAFSPEGLAALDEAHIDTAITHAATPHEAAEGFLAATLLGDGGLTVKSLAEEPLGEIDDAFARIEKRLVTQSS